MHYVYSIGKRLTKLCCKDQKALRDLTSLLEESSLWF